MASPRSATFSTTTRSTTPITYATDAFLVSPITGSTTTYGFRTGYEVNGKKKQNQTTLCILNQTMICFLNRLFYACM